MPFGAFQPPKPAPGGPAAVFCWGRQQGLVASCYVIAREKQLKRWRREKKLKLICTINPEFKDPCTDLGMIIKLTNPI
jgi:hypothetical protein